MPPARCEKPTIDSRTCTTWPEDMVTRRPTYCCCRRTVRRLRRGCSLLLLRVWTGSSMTHGRPQRIVAIGAHLDDIELGCGGTLARAVAQGDDVHMIVMSRSGYANYDGKILRSEAEAMEEGAAAARELGVEGVDVLEFPTKDIPYDSTTVEALNRLLDG